MAWWSKRFASGSSSAVRSPTVCRICGQEGSFIERGPWLRDDLGCSTCAGDSVPRERAAAIVIDRFVPNWRDLRVVECSPAPRGISWKLSNESASYTAINLFPGEQPGAVINGVRNENLEHMTLPDASFDLFVALDVMEHVADPEAAVREIDRILVPNGVAVLTFPIRKFLVEAVTPRAALKANGSIEHFVDPEYHGNPFSEDGALVFTDFGYDVHNWLQEVSGRDVEITRFSHRRFGVLGEFTDVSVLLGS